MELFIDKHNRKVRLTSERWAHIEDDHLEMNGQLDKVQETLSDTNAVVRSRTDSEVELFYRYYDDTPVAVKYLCVVVKVLVSDSFIITAYFTDKIKRGEILWEK